VTFGCTTIQIMLDMPNGYAGDAAQKVLKLRFDLMGSFYAEM
jgi:hypothetical protein